MSTGLGASFLLETAKLNGLDEEAYLRNALTVSLITHRAAGNSLVVDASSDSFRSEATTRVNNERALRFDPQQLAFRPMRCCRESCVRSSSAGRRAAY